MVSCDPECQSDLLRYVVIYWVLLLPLWLAGFLLMAVLYLLGIAYRRWPVAVGGVVLGVTASLTTYGLWVATLSTRDLINQQISTRESAGPGFISV